MASLFLDDSKHPHSGFVLATFVAFPDDPMPAIEEALRDHGLTPYVDEFKSSHRMADKPTLHALRKAFRQLLSGSKVGVAVAASEARLPACSTALLAKMLRYDSFEDKHQVFMDEGIYRRERDRQQMLTTEGAERCSFRFAENSRKRLGIQLADLTASTCGLMMKDSLGLLPKIIKSGENSGYDPDSPMELGFAMWASIRYNLLSIGPQNLDWQTADRITMRTGSAEEYGLVVDDALPERLRTAAHDRFGSVYLGCIH